MSETPITTGGEDTPDPQPPKAQRPRNRKATNELPSHFADVPPRQPYGQRSAFDRRRPAKPSANPKRVRGGLSVKRRADEPPPNWVSQRFLRLVEQAASGGGIVEGRLYAELGQTKRLDVEPGQIVAFVQGRAEKPYSVKISVNPFDRKKTGTLIEALAEQALFSAKLLSGELPSNIEDICGPLGLKLVPTEPGEMTPSCNCPDFTGVPADTGELGPNGEPMHQPTPPPEIAPGTLPGGWCKHLACATLLLAEQLNTEPLLMFRLRGVPEEDLLSRIRETRALAGRGTDALPVYRSHPAAAETADRSPLSSSLDRFWEGGAGLRSLELPQEGPRVALPLLRRLGASPFKNARFPLVGLLATCYEVMGTRALAERDEPDPHDPHDPDTDRGVDGPSADANEQTAPATTRATTATTAGPGGGAAGPAKARRAKPLKK